MASRHAEVTIDLYKLRKVDLSSCSNHRKCILGHGPNWEAVTKVKASQ